MYKTLLGVMKKSCLRAKEKGEKTKKTPLIFHPVMNEEVLSSGGAVYNME